MTVYIGKAKVSSLITVGQFAMIDAQQMKDGGIQVMHVHRILRPMMLARFDDVSFSVRKVVTIGIRLPIGYSGLDSTTCHPSGEGPRMVIAAIILTG
mgnify:CR=1 FL=1